MKTNRRDFIKGALAGIFGAALTWLGAVRAERAQQEPITSDQALDAVIESANKWNDRISDNVSWDYSPETGGVRWVYPVDDGCDKCAWRADCEASDIYQCSAQAKNPWAVDRIWSPSPAWPMAITEDGWTIASDDEGETWHEFSEEEIDAMKGDIPIKGLISGENASAYWGPGGSDENGKGTFEDPVATEACAQSIADNPPFRV